MGDLVLLCFDLLLYTSRAQSCVMDSDRSGNWDVEISGCICLLLSAASPQRKAFYGFVAWLSAGHRVERVASHAMHTSLRNDRREKESPGVD